MASRRYEYVPHTADAAFVAHGRDFREALESAAVALLETMLDVKGIRALRSRQVRVAVKDSAASREDIVWYMLQDILSKIDADKLNAYDFKIERVGNAKGRYTASGTLICKEKEGDFSLLSVKAVTPHGLEIKETREGCSISVVVDV